MRILPILALAISLAASPALAAGEKEEGGKAKKPDPGTTVEMPYLVVPMSQNGKLLGYTYVVSKLVCSSPDACISVREKLAFIQDANVRDVNGKPTGLASDPTQVDKELLGQRLTTNAKRIVGDRKVVSTIFIDVKYAPLHPPASTDGNVPPPERAPGQGQAEGDGKAAPASTTAPKDTAVQKDEAQKSRPK